jgi:hypothetical protein
MSAQQQLIAKYGPPNHDYLIKYCLLWEVHKDFSWFPAHSFLVNKDFKDKLAIAFHQLELKGIHTEIKTFDGCYNDRTVRGSASISLHAWAAAIDLNAATNGMISNPKPEQRHGTWSLEFIGIMKNAGIYFGGDFIHRSDSMHFGLYNG